MFSDPSRCLSRCRLYKKAAKRAPAIPSPRAGCTSIPAAEDDAAGEADAEAEVVPAAAAEEDPPPVEEAERVADVTVELAPTGPEEPVPTLATGATAGEVARVVGDTAIGATEGVPAGEVATAGWVVTTAG